MNSFLTFLIRQQALIKWLFFVGYVILIVTWLTGGWIFSQQWMSYGELYTFGKKFGTLAVILYTASLLPGIMKRMQFLPQLTAVGMLYRRQVGITMFLSAFVHYSFTTMFPFAIAGQMPVVDVARISALFAMLFLVVLFLTSNDFAERKLGKLWRWLQRLTYVALALIFTHVAFMDPKWAVILGTVAILEVVSWVSFFWRRAK